MWHTQSNSIAYCKNMFYNMFIKTNIVKIFFWIETPDILKTNTKQIYVYISLLINMAYTEKNFVEIPI